MSRKVMLISLLIILILLVQCNKQEQDYLGQDPPGLELVRFAPGIISSDDREHSLVTFSPDGKEIYFTRQSEGINNILVTKKTNDGWSDPEPVSFNSEYLDDGTTLTPDGQRLYFGSRRPVGNDSTARGDTEIWMVRRSTQGWSDPVHLSAPINTESSDGFPCITADGTMYFHSGRGEGSKNSDIFRAEAQGDGFSDPVSLPDYINTSIYEAGAYVSDDETILIYFQIDLDDFDNKHLNICFMQSDGTWSKPVDLAETLNLKQTDLMMGRLSPDGKYLFILDAGDIWWVDASVLEPVRKSVLEQ